MGSSTHAERGLVGDRRSGRGDGDGQFRGESRVEGLRVKGPE